MISRRPKTLGHLLLKHLGTCSLSFSHHWFHVELENPQARSKAIDSNCSTQRSDSGIIIGEGTRKGKRREERECAFEMDRVGIP